MSPQPNAKNTSQGSKVSPPVPQPDTGGKPRSFAPKTGAQAKKAGEPVIPVASKGGSTSTGAAQKSAPAAKTAPVSSGASGSGRPGSPQVKGGSAAKVSSASPSPAPATKGGAAQSTAVQGKISSGSAPNRENQKPAATQQGKSQFSSVMSPATSGAKPRPELGAPRRIRLALNRIDPWSAMKFSLLLSLAFGIMLVVASVVFWNVLNSLNVFTEIDTMVKDILGEETEVNILQYVELSRVVSLSTIIAVVDVVLLTAIGTIGAFLYNIVASLVGGLHVTLTDD